MNQSPVLLLKGGKVFCGRIRREILWAEVVAVSGRKILAVGSNDEMTNRFSQAERVDLDGGLLLPGLCDGHLHLAVGGRSLSVPDLSGMNVEQVEGTLKRTAERLALDAWVRAFNWDPKEADLSAELLESWLPGRLVIVHQRDLHSCCVSRTALRAAGISAESLDPPGGRIVRDAQGGPSGQLQESASLPVMRLIPKPARRRITSNANDFRNGSIPARTGGTRCSSTKPSKIPAPNIPKT